MERAKKSNRRKRTDKLSFSGLSTEEALSDLLKVKPPPKKPRKPKKPKESKRKGRQE